jgi:hypothetical protein
MILVLVGFDEAIEKQGVRFAQVDCVWKMWRGKREEGRRNGRVRGEIMREARGCGKKVPVGPRDGVVGWETKDPQVETRADVNKLSELPRLQSKISEFLGLYLNDFQICISLGDKAYTVSAIPNAQGEMDQLPCCVIEMMIGKVVNG